MTADATDHTKRPWPLWMLRYAGSDDSEAFDDLMWSVGGSPPWGGVGYEEAAAVYELLEDYAGPGRASDASYAAVGRFLRKGSVAATALEIFRCLDHVHSDPENYPLSTVERGIALAREVGDQGVEASFLSFQAELHVRGEDYAAARTLTLAALEIYLELADTDEVYDKRVRQSATNAISLTAMAGDLPGARDLLANLAELLDDDTAEELRRWLRRAP
jgi:hypothetical protein